MIQMILKAHCLLIKTTRFLQSPLLLLIRLIWGFQFFQSGLGKLKDIPKVVGFFKELHIPMPEFNAYMAAGTECVGGLLLMVGLFSRVISIPLAVTMIVAFATAESESIQTLLHGDPEKFFAAAPLPFLIASLTILVFGPGVFSLDRLIDALFIKGKKGKS
jgi:putative oxidoreductase